MRALFAKIREILRDRHLRRIWTRVISVMASVVVFISTYALILPAITMESEAACGIEAHQHTDECYEDVLTCGREESEDHQHTDACYTRTLICGKEAHIHSAECYKEDSSAVAVSGGTAVPAVTDGSAGDSSSDQSSGNHQTGQTSQPTQVDVSDASGPSADADGQGASAEMSGTPENAGTTVTAEGLPADANTLSDGTGYVPVLDILNFDSLLTKETGFYYFHAEEGQPVPENSSAITDWKKLKNNMTLASTDLVKAYLAYSIPAGALNETNQTARYRLPANLHLTDDQIQAINRTENGVAAAFAAAENGSGNDSGNGYSESAADGSENTDSGITGAGEADAAAGYEKYLGAEAVEGTRTPDKTLRDGAQEYISATVRAENVYEGMLDENGNYIDFAGTQASPASDRKDLGDYIGQDLIFTFTPYTVQKNQNTYDMEGNPLTAGEKVTGWFAVDFNMDQIDWVEEDTDLDKSTVEKSAEVIFALEDASVGSKERKTTLRLEEQAPAGENGTEDTADQDKDADENADLNKTDKDATDSKDAEENAEKAVDAEDAEKAADHTDGTLKAEGDGYSITLDYTADAQIPENASLSVKEITPDTDPEAYEACLQQAAQKMGASLPENENAGANSKTNAGSKGSNGDAAAASAEAEAVAGTPGTPALDTAASRFFDIEIVVTDEEGKTEKIEPKAPVAVNIQLSSAPNNSANVAAQTKSGSEKMVSGDKSEAESGSQTSDPTVLHFAEEGVETIESTVDSPATGNATTEQVEDTTAISFEAESFSIYGVVYTVDFHYEIDGQIYEYSMEGGSSLTLTNLFEALGLELAVADVKNVEFSNPELLEITYTHGLLGFGEEWILKSLEAFDTEESLTVTLKDGEVFTIQVTDAQFQTTVISASGETYEITVTYGYDARIPAGAELIVKEILPDDEKFDYGTYYQEASDAALDDAAEHGIDQPYISGMRMFDIEIHDKTGEKIEPSAPVQVSVRLIDSEAELMSVVHFAEEGVEMIEVQTPAAQNEKTETKPVLVEEGDVLAETPETNVTAEDREAENEAEAAEESMTEIRFEAQSFSVYNIVNINSMSDILSGGPYALVSGHGPGIATPDSNGATNIMKYALTSTLSDFNVNNNTTAQTVTGKAVYFNSSDKTYGGDVTEWSFEPVTEGETTKYKVYTDSDGTRQYLTSYYNSVGITTDQNQAGQFTVGTSGEKIYLAIDYLGWRVTSQDVRNSSNELVRSKSVFETTGSTDENRTLFTLATLDPDYEENSAQKVSAKDWKAPEGTEGRWDENATVVIYRRIQHADGSEGLYVLATDGTLIPAYDGGDSIFYHCPEGKNVNWHVGFNDGYFISNVIPEGSTEQTVYLAPSVTNGTWSSTSPVGLVLGGMEDDYGTTIEVWDQAAYAYAGLHIDATNAGTLAQGVVPGSGDESDTFLFAVSPDTPLIKERELHTVNTVDSTSMGITMKIFNYGGDTYHYGYRNSAMQAVMGDDMLSDWDNRKSHVTKTVESKLGNDGFPVPLNGGHDSYKDLFTDGAVIEYTANNQTKRTTVQGYDANNLFLQSYYDEDGMFRYSSMENFAHFNTSGENENAGNFTVYRETGTPNIPTAGDHYYYYHGHFMPYNDLDPTVSVSRLVDQYGSLADKEEARSYENVYGLKETPDYYVGMSLEAKFVQPTDGTLANGDPVVYRFTGDDDLLVYIDGILVLDVGGIHEPLTGSINFETGVVLQPNFYGEGDGWKTHETTLYKIFQEAYKSDLISADDWAKMKWVDADGDGEYDTFADHTTHDFKMFYMERGAGASNLDLQFNLQVIKKDEFTVRKILPEDVKPEFVNQLYKFKAYFIDETETNPAKQKKPLYPGAKKSDGTEVCSSVVYDGLTDATGKPVTKNVPFNKDDHSFTLRAGEAAKFKMTNDQIVYDVYEVDIDGSLIETVDINGQSTTITKTESETVPSDVNAGDDSVENRGVVNVTNTPKTQNLRVTKHITANSLSNWENDKPVFEFRVYLEQFVTDKNGDLVLEDGKPKTKLVPYARSPYYLVKIPEGQENNEAAWEYYTLTGENNAPVKQPHGTVCSITGRSGTINSIPPEYTIIIPDLAVGTHFYVEERRVTIPKGYEFDHEVLKEDTYEVSALGASVENIDQVMTIDEYSNNEAMYFDAESVGRIKDGTDAEFDVWNRKPAIEIPVEKIWHGGDEGNRPPVTLALIRYMPVSNYKPPTGKSAILIDHVADYGETNSSTALPDGFVATYSIEKLNTETGEYTLVAAGTSGPFDVDPGTYRVSTTINNRGSEPTNYTYSRTEPVVVTVEANQSKTAKVTSEYNYEAGGQITISHNAIYEGGDNPLPTGLPEGFTATYTIRDQATNRIVHRNVGTGTYDVPAGTYIVTANVSNGGSSGNYVYESTTTVDPVAVTSSGSGSAVFISNYVYVAPKSYGYITVSHESSGLTGISPNLPQNFQVTSYRIVGPTTINNAQLGHEYKVEAGNYTVIANVNYAPVVDGFDYVGTSDQEVVVGTNVHESVKLTSIYAKQGEIEFEHKITGLPGTVTPPDYNIVFDIINSAGVTVKQQKKPGDKVAVPAGDYTVKVYIYNIQEITSEAPDGYFYLGTPETVNVTVPPQGGSVTASVESKYGANGTLTVNHIANYGEGNSSTSLPSNFQVQYIVTDKKTGNAVEGLDHVASVTNHSIAPGEYTVTAVINYQQVPDGYTYVKTDPVDVTVVSDTNTTATLTSVYSFNGSQGGGGNEGGDCTVTLWTGQYSLDAGTKQTRTVTPGSKATLTVVSKGEPTVKTWDSSNPSYDSTSGYDQSGAALQERPSGVDVGNGFKSYTYTFSNINKSMWIGALSQYHENNATVSLDIEEPDSSNNVPGNVKMQMSTQKVAAQTGISLTTEGTSSTESLTLFSRFASLFSAPGTKAAPDQSTIDPTTLSIPEGYAANIDALNDTLAAGSASGESGVETYQYVLDPTFGKQVVLSDSWDYTFQDLEELGDGSQPYYYALVEVQVPKDYSVSYSQNMPVSASVIRANMDDIAEAKKEGTTPPAQLTLSATNSKDQTDFSFSKVWLKQTANQDNIDAANDLLSWPEGKTITVKVFRKNGADSSAVVDSNFELVYTLNGTAGTFQPTSAKPALSEGDTTYQLTGTTSGNVTTYSMGEVLDSEWYYYVAETAVPEGYQNVAYGSKTTNETTTTITKQQGADKAAKGGVILNQEYSGYELPSTGGPGTRLFTILGSILILGAGVLLWRRRRTI